MKPTSPTVSILIVTYDSAAVIDACLTSIAACTQIEHEIILVDNASHDNTLARVQEHHPAVQCIANRSNQGFAAAVNQASSKAQGEFLFLLNPDTVLQAQALDTLVAELRLRPDAGLCAPRILHPDGRLRTNCFVFGGPLRFFLQAVLIGPGHWLSRFLLPAPPWRLSEDRIQSVEAASGAALLIRTSLFRRLSGLDERFFMYYEDFDLCRRARAEKQQTLYVPDAVVMHIGGHSLPTDIVRIHGMSGPLGLVAQYRYIEKYAGRQAARCLRCAYMLAGMSLCSLASLWPDPTQRRQALRYGRLLAQTSLPRTFSMREGKEHHAQ